jgi:MFS family permease
MAQTRSGWMPNRAGITIDMTSTSPPESAQDDTEPPPNRHRWRQIRPRVWRTAPTVGHPDDLMRPSLRQALQDVQLPQTLRQGPFRVYWLAQMLALITMWMQSIAANLVILDLTTSAFKIGLINITSGVPMLLLSLFGGVVADRIDRRRIVMVTQSILIMLSLTWAALIASGTIAYWHVLVMAGIGGVVVSFDQPASQSLLGQLVRRDHLAEALALTSMSGNSTRIYAPLLGGVVIGVVGLSAAFIGHAFSLIVFVTTIWSLRRTMAQPLTIPRRGSPLIFLREGLGYARRDDAMIGLVLITFLFSLLTLPLLLVLMPFFVTDVLGGSDRWVPISTSVFGIGSFAAAITLFRGSTLERAAGRRLRFTLLGIAVGMIWLALSPTPVAALPGIALCGCCFEMGLLQVLTRLQQLATDEMRGRVMSLNGIALNGAMPLATFSSSLAVQEIGMRPVLLVAAAAFACTTYLVWKRYTVQAFAEMKPQFSDGVTTIEPSVGTSASN